MHLDRFTRDVVSPSSPHQILHAPREISSRALRACHCSSLTESTARPRFQLGRAALSVFDVLISSACAGKVDALTPGKRTLIITDLWATASPTDISRRPTPFVLLRTQLLLYRSAGEGDTYPVVVARLCRFQALG